MAQIFLAVLQMVQMLDQTLCLEACLELILHSLVYVNHSQILIHHLNFTNRSRLVLFSKFRSTGARAF